MKFWIKVSKVSYLLLDEFEDEINLYLRFAKYI